MIMIIMYYIYITGPLAKWVKCSSVVRETGSIPGQVIPKTQK